MRVAVVVKFGLVLTLLGACAPGGERVVATKSGPAAVFPGKTGPQVGTPLAGTGFLAQQYPSIREPALD
jgi:hypothetical protein